MTACSGTPVLVADEDGDIFFQCDSCDFYFLLGRKPTVPQVITVNAIHRSRSFDRQEQTT